MQAFDLSPLFRSTVGFDRLAHLAEAARRGSDSGQAYPPYNIEKHGDDRYAITLAVAGFDFDDLAVEVAGGTLTIAGRKAGADLTADADADDGEEVHILHRGIALRDFVRRFQIADHVVVDGADLDNGLLTVRLHAAAPAVPKPRQVRIEAAA